MGVGRESSARVWRAQQREVEEKPGNGDRDGEGGQEGDLVATEADDAHSTEAAAALGPYAVV